MAVVSSSSATHVLLQRLLRPPPPPQQQPPPSVSCILRPLFTTISTPTCTAKSILSNHQNPTNTLFSFFQSTPFTSRSLLSAHFPLNAIIHTSSLEPQEQEEEEEEEEEEFVTDSGSESLELGDDVVVEDGSEEGLMRNGFKVPNLSIKEKKELASYAHSLGKKLKSQLVGKSGVTDNVATSFIETLEANELLKIKIHRTCPGELEDVVQRLQESTGSVVVSQIGRTVIVYRPSISKMEAEEKRQQARKIYVRKESRFKPLSLMQRRALPRLSGRGRRGSSRM